MELVLPTPGRYILAVSGGVDSVALLHRLVREPELQLTVAHFDHGIRSDSGLDRQLVQVLAENYGLPFIYETAELGPAASEAAARQARYDFLQRVRQEREAAAIITAHHEDDVLETAVINLLRGSGRKGLTSLGDRADVLRPLLRVPKRDIVAYAQDQGLTWREDSTNQNEAYLRNYIRKRLLPRFDHQERERLLSLISGMRETNNEIDTLLVKYLQDHTSNRGMERTWFVQLPHNLARETMAAWLRANGLTELNRPLLERAVVAAKTARPGKAFPLAKNVYLLIERDYLALGPAER